MDVNQALGDLELDNVLSSDAEVSNVMSAENADFQPMKLWYGSHDHAQLSPLGLGAEPGQQARIAVNHLLGLDPVFSKFTGAGTTIAILDSGINTKHAAFTNRISPASKSFVSDSIEDVLGHGTSCAGLACGSIVPFTIGDIDPVHVAFVGAAQEAKVMVCKVTPDGTKNADIDAVIRAIDYILAYNKWCSADNRANDRVSVVSISWGMPKFHFVLSKKIQEMISDDVIVVCAASNSGRKLKHSIMYPARLGHVLCIGSCNSDGVPSSFSPRGRELDFLAPGENLWAPTKSSAPKRFATVKGTSFAAPLVAGLVCRIIQDLRKLSIHYDCPMIIDQLHTVWGMREILKRISTLESTHAQEEGFGILQPKDYFEKNRNERKNFLKKLI